MTDSLSAPPELLAAYHDLDADDRRILQVLALIGLPVTQGALQSTLDILAFEDAKRQPLTKRVNSALMERLLERELISRTRNFLLCHPLITEIAAREVAHQGDLDAIAGVTGRDSLKAIPGQDPRETLWLRKMRELRIPLLSDNEGELMAKLKLTPRTAFVLQPIAAVNALIQVCLTPLDEEWFGHLPGFVKFQVLTAMLKVGSMQLTDQHQAYRLMERYFPELAKSHPEAAHALTEQRLFRGRMDTATEALLAGDASAAAAALRGWLRVLQGEYDQARAEFLEALRKMRSGNRKRNPYLPGMPGVLYLATLLHGGESAQLQLAAKQVEAALNAGTSEAFATVFHFLDEATAVLRGLKPLSDCAHLNGDHPHDTPYTHLFQCMILSWLGGTPRARQAAKLPQYCMRAREAGFEWFSCESALVLRALDKAPECEDAVEPSSVLTDFVPLGDLIEPRQAWELALQALSDIPGENGAATVAGGETGLRMTWRIRCNGPSCTLEPREQKRARHGGWTKGRAVALQRLHQHPEEFDYLRPQDRELCKCIQTETGYSYFGRYADVVYTMDRGQALLAAVGHPLVFRDDQPSVRVDLVGDEPVLEIHRRDDTLHLELVPKPQPPHETVALEDAEQRIRIVHFKPEHMRIAAILGENGLDVPNRAKQQVLSSIAAIAPLLTVHSDIGGGDQADLANIAPDERLHLRLQAVGDGLGVECVVQPLGADGPAFRPGEGGRSIYAQVDDKRLGTDRDLEAETSAGERLLARCPTLQPSPDWTWLLGDPETALETLLQFQDLDAKEASLEWPKGKPIQVSAEAGLAQMNLSLAKQRDWFAVDGELKLEDGKVLPMQRLLALLDQHPGRFIRLDDDDFLTLAGDLRQRLDTLRALSDKGRFHPLAAPAVEDAAEGMNLRTTKAWKDHLQRITAAEDQVPEVPSTLQAQLRDYQLDGFRWLARLAHWGAGACLADDMGLGKTIQTLALVLTRAPDGPTLVLAPTSVCTNWLEEAARFAPTLRPMRFGPGDRRAMLDQAGPFDLIVASYGLLQSEQELLAEVEWRTIVADEAQALKNPLTKRAKAAQGLQGGFKIITTGTPIENHLGELWSLFRIINPGLLGAQRRFNERFANPIEQRRDSAARDTLRRLIRPFILRRLKSEVLSELPPRTEITLHVELSEDEAAFYEALRRNAVDRVSEADDNPGQHRVRVLAEITRLRRACCNPKLVVPDSPLSSSKLEAFMGIVEELRENRHKALVFSQFVSHLELLRARLDERGVRYQYLDGATSAPRRKEAVDAFQAGLGDLFLISLKAGGSGLNLTAADYVIHMDPWWNPAVEDQASDRAHRLGQQRPVTIYRLVAKDTIEEKIVALHGDKRDLADSLLEGSEMSGKMSVEEMIDLIGEQET